MFIINFCLFISIFEALNKPKKPKSKSDSNVVINLDSDDDTIDLTKQFSSEPLKILSPQKLNLLETHALDIPTQNKNQKKTVISKLF